MAKSARFMFNARGITGALNKTASIACQHMANDTREKTVNYIMGNRSRDNPFPKNRVKKDGSYYTNSVARKPGLSPRSYVKPKDPISISQIEYTMDGRSSQRIGSKAGVALNLVSPVYIVGPIGGHGKTGVPRTLEQGGTTQAFYREVKKNGKTVRWEFRTHKPKSTKADTQDTTKTKGKNNGRPIRYSSWSQVNEKLRSRGQQVGGSRGPISNPEADAAFIAQGWLGPKTFNVKRRPYISRGWAKVRKRGKWYITRASKSFSNSFRQHSSLITVA